MTSLRSTLTGIKKRKPRRAGAGEKSQRGFFGWFEADKPSATLAADASWADAALALPEAACPPWPAQPADARPCPSLFTAASLLETEELDAAEIRTFFGAAPRHEEHESGRLLSFFTGVNSHVVLKPKELQVLRPHGHLLRTGGALTPDEAALTSTAWMGGLQTYFQRIESASYFGQEIGLMYTHAHLRYGEALARFGDADGLFRALCQFNTIALREIVPSAGLRQANCYTSSSDPAFADRYEAFEHYDRVSRGEVALEGGWRVYSSGAGIGVRLIMQAFWGSARSPLH